MAERMDDGGGTKVEQAERAEQPEPAQAVEPERRPTYKTLDEQQGRLTERRAGSAGCRRVSATP